MNIRGINWARQHDWFMLSSLDRVTGEWYVIARDDMVSGEQVVFTDFDKMRTWAGY